MATEDSNSPRPFAWAIIPIVVVFFFIFIGSIIFFRRRRRRSPDFVWSRTREFTSSGGRRVGNRWVPWPNMRSQEGLNELGEAPPPYDGQKNPAEADAANGDASGAGGATASGNGHNTTNGGETRTETGTELRDLEAGVLPPEYPAEPPPAVIANPRRSG